MPDSLNGGYWTLLDEVTEIEGGRSCARPAMAKAVLLCRLDGGKADRGEDGHAESKVFASYQADGDGGFICGP